MSLSLILAGAAMGAVSSPHCITMCGAPCAAVCGGEPKRTAGFLLGRALGYGLAGAVAAASVGVLAAWSRESPALRPAWLFLHLAFVMLGAWWLFTGRQPRGLRAASVAGLSPIRWAKVPPAVRAPAAGLAWVAWPCGVLQGALGLASLAGTPAAGAGVMVAFAVASAPSLALAPLLWRGIVGRWPGTAVLVREGLGLRVAGATLMVMSGWALGHGLWVGAAGWCLAP
jgi:hypothetical protein